MTNDLPHWDLSNVYPGLESDQFQQAVRQIKAQLEDLDGYLESHNIAHGGPVPSRPAELADVISGKFITAKRF